MDVDEGNGESWGSLEGCWVSTTSSIKGVLGAGKKAAGWLPCAGLDVFPQPGRGALGPKKSPGHEVNDEPSKEGPVGAGRHNTLDRRQVGIREISHLNEKKYLCEHDGRNPWMHFSFPRFGALFVDLMAHLRTHWIQMRRERSFTIPERSCVNVLSRNEMG